MYIVMCSVTGGVTGTREAPLKEHGQIRQFTQWADAHAEALRLNALMNGDHYRTATFRYWVEHAY